MENFYATWWTRAKGWREDFDSAVSSCTIFSKKNTHVLIQTSVSRGVNKAGLEVKDSPAAAAIFAHWEKAFGDWVAECYGKFIY